MKLLNKVKKLLKKLLRSNKMEISSKDIKYNKIWLTKLELIVHNEHINIDIYLSFFINHLYELYNSL